MGVLPKRRYFALCAAAVSGVTGKLSAILLMSGNAALLPDLLFLCWVDRRQLNLLLSGDFLVPTLLRGNAYRARVGAISDSVIAHLESVRLTEWITVCCRTGPIAPSHGNPLTPSPSPSRGEGYRRLFFEAECPGQSHRSIIRIRIDAQTP